MMFETKTHKFFVFCFSVSILVGAINAFRSKSFDTLVIAVVGGIFILSTRYFAKLLDRMEETYNTKLGLMQIQNMKLEAQLEEEKSKKCNH
jgi:hypothetical protein